MPPPPKDQTRLAAWHGTPLDSQNRGCYLETGTLVCQVGDPSRLEAMLVIDQSAVAFVRAGQQVRLRIDQGPVHIVTGTNCGAVWPAFCADSTYARLRPRVSMPPK